MCAKEKSGFAMRTTMFIDFGKLRAFKGSQCCVSIGNKATTDTWHGEA
jgi:hypothetical protein